MQTMGVYFLAHLFSKETQFLYKPVIHFQIIFAMRVHHSVIKLKNIFMADCRNEIVIPLTFQSWQQHCQICWVISMLSVKMWTSFKWCFSIFCVMSNIMNMVWLVTLFRISSKLLLVVLPYFSSFFSYQRN